jgi:hypothetical protein
MLENVSWADKEDEDKMAKDNKLSFNDFTEVQLVAQIAKTWRDAAKSYRKAGAMKLCRDAEARARKWEEELRMHATACELA